MNPKEMFFEQPQNETEKQFDSFESAAEQLKSDFQDMFSDIPIYEEMKDSRLEFALDGYEDLLTEIYLKTSDFYHDIKNVMEDVRGTFDYLHQFHEFSHLSIMEVLKKRNILYVSPGSVVDEATGVYKHVCLFIAADNQFVVTFQIDPQEEIKNEAQEIIESGLL